MIFQEPQELTRMEVDMGTAITGIVFLALFALPFVLDRRSRDNKKKRALLSLQQLAEQHQCRIDHHELSGAVALGLDERKNAIFYLRQEKEGHSSQYAHLAEMRSCNLVNSMRSTKQGGAVIAPTDRVQLNLQPRDSSKAEVQLEIFDAGSGLQLNGELQVAERWSKLIHERLKNAAN